MTARSARSRLAGRLALGVLLLLAMLLAAHSLAWRWTTSSMAEAFSDWVTTRRAQGWTVQHGMPQRGGWPFAAQLTIPGLRVEGRTPTLPEGFIWESGRLVLRIAPPRLERLVIEARGPQRLALGEAAIPFAADRLEAVLPLEPGVPPRSVEILAERLRAGLPQGLFELREARLSLSGRLTATEAEPALLVGLEAVGVSLPPMPGVPAVGALGQHVEEIALQAQLSGPLPPMAPLATRAESWRDAGGSLDLRSLSLRWGPLAGDASMTLSLDEALQPMGAGTLQLAGAPEALSALAEAGLVGRRAAMTAQGVLGLLARVPEGGGRPRVEVPVTIENGVVALGRIPLARLAPLAWPRERGASVPR